MWKSACVQPTTVETLVRWGLHPRECVTFTLPHLKPASINVLLHVSRNVLLVTTETPSACLWGNVFPVTVMGIRTSV